MLVLSRKPGQRLRIGANITLTLLEVHGKRVTVAIEAPPHVVVLREELFQDPASQDVPAPLET